MLEFYTYNLATKSPLYKQRTGVILSYKFHDKTLLAESSPLPDYNQESLHDVLVQLKEILPYLLKIQSLEDFNNWDQSYELYPSLQFALYSLYYQISNPINYPFSIPIRRFIHIPYQDDASSAKLLDKLTSLSLSNCVKIKLGSYPLEKAISLVKAALSITKVPLILDFNEKWSLEKMQRFCDNFAPISFEHLEDPLDNPLDLFALAKSHPYPIAIEQGLRLYGIEPFLSLPTLKACEFKPTIDMPLLRNASFLKTLSDFNMKITFSSAYETAVGLSAIGYLAHQIAPLSYHGLDTLS
ncbi:MAG: enolase C-terminal domain-like protein, partial [Chlamydiota bacterium]